MPIIIPYIEIESARQNIIKAVNDQGDIITRFNVLQQQYPFTVMPYPMEALAQLRSFEMMQYSYVLEVLNASVSSTSADSTLNEREKTCALIVIAGLFISWNLEYQLKTGAALQISSEVQDLQGILETYNQVQLQQILTDNTAYYTYLEQFVLLTLRTGNIHLLEAAVRSGARLYDSQKVLRALHFRSQSPHKNNTVDLLRTLTTKPIQEVAAPASVQSEEVRHEDVVVAEQQVSAIEDGLQEEAAHEQTAASDELEAEEVEVVVKVAREPVEPKYKAPRVKTPAPKLTPAECLSLIQNKSSNVKQLRSAWNTLLELPDLDFYALEVEFTLPPLQALSGQIKKHDEKLHNSVKVKRNNGQQEYVKLHPPIKAPELEAPAALVANERTEETIAVMSPAPAIETTTHTTLTDPELLTLIKSKGIKADAVLMQQLQAQQLSIDLCQKILALTNISPEITYIVLTKIADPQLCSVRDFFILDRRFGLQVIANKLETLPDKQGSIAILIRERIEACKVWAAVEAQIILPAIFAKQEITITDKLNLALFAEQKNAAGQTPLMLAFMHNKEVNATTQRIPVAEAVFQALLDASGNTLVETDANGNGVLFYAARYFDPKLSKFLRKLLGKCITVAADLNLVRQGHVLPFMLDKCGNTFMHEYFKGDHTDGEMLQGFRAWESAAKDLPEKEDLIHSLVLVRNFSDEAVIDILDQKDKDLPKTADYLYQLLPTAIYKFFANIHNAAFSLNAGTIPHLYATEQFSRLIKTLERRYALREEVKKALVHINKTQKKRLEKIPELLGENELSYLRIGEFLLFDLMAAFAIKHPEYREPLIASRAYQDVQLKYIPISLEVRLLKKHASENNSKPLPRYIIPTIKAAMAAINNEAILQGRFGIFFDNLNTLKLVHEQCDIAVTDKEIFFALSELDFAYNEHDAEKLNFILSHFRKAGPFTNYLTYTMFLHLIANAHDADKIAWLANKDGINPAAIYEGWTVLHFLLHEGVPQDHDFIVAAIKAVLSNPNSRKALLEFRDEDTHGCLELASTKLSKLSEDKLYELFKTLLDHGADLNAMRSTGDLKNALHWVAFTCAPKLVYLFTQHLTKAQFLSMLKENFSAKRINFLNTDIYKYMQRVLPNAPKLIVSHEEFRQIELLLSDPQIPNDAIVSSVLDTCTTKVDSLLASLKDDPENIELRNQLQPLIQIPMSHGATVLMLCFERDLPLTVIDFVIENSKHSLHKWNYNQELVLHVWARHYKPEWLPFFTRILELSKQHAYSIEPDKVMFAFTQTDSANETFLHSLARRVDSESIFIGTMLEICSPTNMRHFSRLAIYKNNAYETPTYIIECKPQEWSTALVVLHDVMFWAIANVQDLSIAADGTPKQECLMFHDKKEKTYIQMVTQNDYYRLIATLDRNFALQTRIAALKSRSEALKFFDATRTLEIHINGRSLFMHAADYVFSANDPLLEEMWMNSECYLQFRNKVALSNCFEYRRVIAAIEQKGMPDPKYAKSLAKYIDSGMHQTVLDEIILELVPLDINVAVEFVQYILKNIDEEQRSTLINSKDINNVSCFEVALAMILEGKKHIDETETLPVFMLRAYDLLNILLVNGAQPTEINSEHGRNVLHFIAMIGDVAIAQLVIRRISKEDMTRLLSQRSTKDNLTVKEFAEEIYTKEGAMSGEFHRYFNTEVCTETADSGQALGESSATSLTVSASKNSGAKLFRDL